MGTGEVALSPGEISVLVAMFAILIWRITVVIRRLVRLHRKTSGYLDSADSARLGDALYVIGGVALLAYAISGLARWGVLDYAFFGLLTLQTVLTITATTLTNRALDRGERKNA